jgi:hypothetical protein
MTFAEAAALAAAGGVGRLWLTHFSPAVEDPDAFLANATAVFPERRSGKPGWRRRWRSRLSSSPSPSRRGSVDSAPGVGGNDRRDVGPARRVRLPNVRTLGYEVRGATRGETGLASHSSMVLLCSVCWASSGHACRTVGVWTGRWWGMPRWLQLRRSRVSPPPKRPPLGPRFRCAVGRASLAIERATRAIGGRMKWTWAGSQAAVIGRHHAPATAPLPGVRRRRPEGGTGTLQKSASVRAKPPRWGRPVGATEAVVAP